MASGSDFERRYFGQKTNSSGAIGSTRSPNVTPTKAHCDRFIPIRQPTENWSNRYHAIQSPEVGPPEFKRPASAVRQAVGGGGGGGPTNNQQANTSPNSGGSNLQNEDTMQDQLVVRALIRNELMEDRIDDMGLIKEEPHESRSPARRNLFSYAHKTPTKYGEAGTSARVPLTNSPSVFSCPLSEESQRLLKSPRKPQRKVPKNPYKVLDAPELQDDFYLNLVDWSSQNMLSVGLNTCVYLWSASNSQVIKLCDLSHEGDTVTSVQWTDKGEYLAVGTNKGKVQIWDVHTSQCILDREGHSQRIGCLAWNGDQICSGSRDRSILLRDIRAPQDHQSQRKLVEHRQEVCGLKWSPDKQYLASGGNDNQLIVWGHRRDNPVHKWGEHNAAVKALAWSPHHHGLLVSGGGTADRCLRFWNTLTGQPMQCIDTGSQVCNVAWSKHSSELVSTHGYSYNQVIIWKYPTLVPVTKLTGHQFRVLYLAMSPDGEAIVTGAGDETLRFWHVFTKSKQKAARSKLNLFNTMR